MLDGVKPERDTFHPLIVGTMKGSRLQDVSFFRDEMKSMGLALDGSSRQKVRDKEVDGMTPIVGRFG
ncbi:pentatricopeptide repeat-containing At4g35850, mitochondrial [Olea europaea subsp. europaea]|uniref:Pentatricopeptide repeat-containing At4g35850, mitochondrial n=1 Tax=Olea europaea subsp. europaea TaxID=158383 RepID=A0A8S0TNY5_OLEEU|nr:pentatricopeptide repeat-containing At4g35850, mitochondrial [Olea europaea subsp. europaea]